jgi:hypothetical protein
MSARTIKNPATVSGQGNLASDSLTLSNTVNCVLTSNSAGISSIELIILNNP